VTLNIIFTLSPLHIEVSRALIEPEGNSLMLIPSGKLLLTQQSFAPDLTTRLKYVLTEIT
jgi:hypothetical protein